MPDHEIDRRWVAGEVLWQCGCTTLEEAPDLRELKYIRLRAVHFYCESCLIRKATYPITIPEKYAHPDFGVPVV